MNKRNYAFLMWALIVALSVNLTACKQKTRTAEAVKTAEFASQVAHPDWAKNVSIYEVNVRQFTPEGTFEALEAHLPRLKELGTEIIWLMPIYPIGEKNRKGELGSYYSISDYRGINPEFGNPDSFRSFVAKAHDLGLKVILDWVANHTAWDHAWVTGHPDWYQKDSVGNMVAPFDWTDVAQLDYTNDSLRAGMLADMKYWVTEFDVDGFRCDVAELVPMDFWNNARAELDRIKPVFMLAEGEKPELHSAFDMTYSWTFHHLMNQYAKGEKTVNDLETYIREDLTKYPENAYRMHFITNHDENSWNGTEYERLGDGANAFFVLSATIPGIPLVYSGQEAAMDKRLEFFTRDAINWKDYPLSGLYQTMLKAKTQHEALWNGTAGGDFTRLAATGNDKVFAYARVKGNSTVVAVLNLSATPAEFTLNGQSVSSELTDIFSGEKKAFGPEVEFSMKPWSYYVFVK